MKRILSACIEQTQRFESERDYQIFISGMERKRTKYKILEKDVQQDIIVVKLLREYNNYPVGDYLE